MTRTLQIPFWSFVQSAMQMGVALLSARWLGPAERGELVLATTIGTLLLLVSSMGTGAASRVVLAEPGRWWNWSRYTGLAALLTVPHVVLSATVGLFLLSRFADPSPGTQAMFIVYSATALAAHLFREGLHGLGRHRTSFVIDVTVAALQLVLIVAAHELDEYSAAMALGIASLCFAYGLVVQTLIGRRADTRGRTFPGTTLREWWSRSGALVRFSQFALVTALGQSFVVNGDRLVLGAVGRTSQVGLYSAAASLATLSSIAPIALTALLTRKTAEQGTLQSWRRANAPVLVLTSAVAVAVAVVGWFAIPVLLGEEFASARPLLPILCAAAIPYGSCQIDAAACAGLRDLRTGALVSTLGCAALVVFAASGYQVLGPAGVACGVLATYLLMALVARIRLRRLIAARGAV